MVKNGGQSTPRKSPRLVSSSRGDSTPSKASPSPGKSSRRVANKVGSFNASKKREYLAQIEWGGDTFCVGDDVYVTRSGQPLESDEELEECRVCGETGGEVMIECDKCLGGFHLACLNPALESVPEGDWLCSGCENGAQVVACENKNRRRTARERLLNEELWAARIERLWEEPNGLKFFAGCWYLIPEATDQGRQDHNGRRELYRTNHFDQNEVVSIIKHCYVLTPDEFSKANTEVDDIFYCKYEYDVRYHTYRRIDELTEKVDEEECFEDSKRSSSQRKRKPGSSSKTPRKKTRTEIAGLENLKTRRVAGEGVRSLTEIEKAKAFLALSAAPDSLPCREKEKSEIESFVLDAIGNGADCLGKCLYISGVPGTGKTATVLDVMKNMEQKLSSKEIQPYQFVELNGLRLTSPEQTYTVLHEAFTGQRLGWKKALQQLDERFSSSKSSKKSSDGRPCILLVDELDLLVTRSQSVLYNLFDWPCRPSSRLVVIGIANTIDLPERLLPRIASRMGLQRVSFNPYSYQQLQQIISYRLSGTEAFEKPAVEFASRKVAAVSGDARRALELCRRAAELAEARQDSRIGMSDVEAAVNEMFQAPHVQVMRKCSKHAKIFLVAMVYEYLKSGMAETSFEQVSRSHVHLCSHNGEEPPSRDNLLLIGCRLGECRLLLCESGSRHRLQKLQLNFPSDDVSFALKDTPELPWITKYLCSSTGV